MMRPNDWKKIKHFGKSEWVDFPDKVARELAFTLDEVRGIAGCPIFILQCGAYEGHSDYSYHYISLAVDFYFQPDKLTAIEQFIILSSFPQIGAIGYYPFSGSFWHIDLRFAKPRVLWYRDENRSYHYGFKNLRFGLRMGD